MRQRVARWSRPSTGPGWLDALEHVLAALADRPVDDGAKLGAHGAVNAVLLAYVRSETTGHQMAERTLDRLSSAANDGRHPHIAALRVNPASSGADDLRRTLAGVLTGLLDAGKDVTGIANDVRNQLVPRREGPTS